MQKKRRNYLKNWLINRAILTAYLISFLGKSSFQFLEDHSDYKKTLFLEKKSAESFQNSP